MPLRHGYIESAVLIVLSLALAAIIGTLFLLLTAGFLLLTGFAYNYRPFALKSHPLRGLWANATMGWFAFAVGWSAIAPFDESLGLVSLPYYLFNGALCIMTTLPDHRGDATTGKVTVAVRYGFLRMMQVSTLLMLLALASAAVQGDLFLTAVVMVTMPWMVKALYARKLSAVIIALKMGIFFFSLGVCIKFPPYVVLIVVAYFLSRFYYQKRFGFDYPNFRGS